MCFLISMLYNKEYGTTPRCLNGPFVFLHFLKHDFSVLQIRFNNVRHGQHIVIFNNKLC